VSGGRPPVTPEARAARRRARRRRVRRRRILALGIVAGAAALAVGLAWSAGGETRSANPRSTSRVPAVKCKPAESRPRTVPPPWITKHRATVLVDSVLLGGVPALRGNFQGWTIDVVGRPAIMLYAMSDELAQSGRRIAPLVIAGVGHNSLWEKHRLNYRRWAERFDGEAIELLRTLKRQGAKQIVWVTLREARRAVIPSSALWQYDKYSWYFQYVNERLRRLDRRRADVVLADWAAVSDRGDITYDAFHLNPVGAALMARTIRSAVQAEARSQTRVNEPPKRCRRPAGGRS
jgi:hypothetical protein